MLREDYETPFTTLNQPFEIGVPNQNQRFRIIELAISRVKLDQLFPHRQVIRFNSTYVEVMDSWEFIRGRAIGLAIPMWSVCLFGIGITSIISFDMLLKHEFIYLFVFGGFGLAFAYMIYIYYKIARYDLFGYTHYPIRFNRKTQKVYAFSPQQQKVIELNWKDLRFSLVPEKSNIGLRASNVDEHNIVKDEVIFPYVAAIFSHRSFLEKHLAFFKAYMDGEDLQRLDDAIPEFFDIYYRKETWKETFERKYMYEDILNELTEQYRPKQKDIASIMHMAGLFFPSILMRRLSVSFSKIPKWPEHIEAECQIEANDPYDSTGKVRHLEPLVFTLKEKLLIFIGWLIGTTIFVGFLVALAVFSLNTW